MYLEANPDSDIFARSARVSEARGRQGSGSEKHED